MVVVEISLLQGILLFLAVATLGLLFVFAWFFIKFKRNVKEFIKLLVSNVLERDELDELIERRFILLCKDDEMFKKHIENKVVGVDKNAGEDLQS